MSTPRYLEAQPSGTVRARGVLVLLHAFPLRARMWQPQFTALSEHGWHVLAPEMASGTMDECAGDVVDLLDALHVHDAVVGGCSMGGYLALNVFRHAANYVRGLVLIDTRAPADAPEALEGRRRLIKLAEEQGPSAVVDDMLPKLLGDTTRRERPDVVDLVRSIGMEHSGAAVARMVRVLMSRVDATPLLATIHVPTLIVVGEEDTITPVAMAQQLQGGIAGAQLVVLPGVGHLPNLEEPRAFNDAVASFLDRRV
jgi:pimeloyl-ACP methyl ester carboxylesterase